MTAYPRDGNQIPCVQTTPPSAYPTHKLPPTGGVSPQAPTLSSTLPDPPLLSEPSPSRVVEAPAPLPWPRLQLLTRPAALPLTPHLPSLLADSCLPLDRAPRRTLLRLSGAAAPHLYSAKLAFPRHSSNPTD